VFAFVLLVVFVFVFVVRRRDRVCVCVLRGRCRVRDLERDLERLRSLSDVSSRISRREFVSRRHRTRVAAERDDMISTD